MTEQPRLLIYTFDGFGLGHFMRGLKIADAFHKLYPTLSTLIVTGSSAASRFEKPRGVRLLEIPSLSRDENRNRLSRDPRYSLEEARALRRELLLGAARDFQPGLVIADNNPLGTDGEALPALTWLKEQDDTSIVLSIRDIVGTPEVIRESWQAFGGYTALEEIYEKIFVYGVPEFDDPVSSYGLSERVREKIVYTGFIPDFVSRAEAQDDLVEEDGWRRIFLTLGSGEDGEEVVAAFLEMISSYGGVLNASCLVVTGPLLPDAPSSQFAEIAASLGVEFKSFVSSIVPYLKSSDLVISMGEYNTTMEILSHAEKALIIPRVRGRADQLLRAHRLSQLGLIEFIPSTELTPDLLFEKVEQQLASEDRPLFRARQAGLLPMNGAEVLARACEPLLFKRNKERT